MWPWKRKAPPADAGTPPLVAERLGSIERLVRALDEDLGDLHDRFQRFQGRTVKRAALDAADATPAKAPPSTLVDPASARILSLRNRTKMRPGGVS